MHHPIRTLLFIAIGLFSFTVVVCCLTPIKYTTLGTFVKQSDREHVVLSKEAKSQIDRRSISRCPANISNRSFSIHLSYLGQDNDHSMYDCWLESGDDLDLGLYEINLNLGEIKLWSILLHYF